MAPQHTNSLRKGESRVVTPLAAGPTAPLIDTAQVAGQLGVTPRFVRRLVDERRIRFYKIGKYVRFDPADIDRFAAAARVEPPGVVQIH